MKVENTQTATTVKNSDLIINRDNFVVKKNILSLVLPPASQETNEKINRILNNLHTDGEVKNTDNGITVHGKKIEVEFWNPFKAIGNAIKKAAKKIGKAIVDTGKSISTRIGDITKSIAQGVFRYARNISLGAWNTAVGIVKNVGEGLGNIVDGAGEILQGKFKNGFKNIAKGIFKVVVQTPVDALLMGAGSTVSAIQSLTGIEPVGRKLSDQEIQKLKPIFGNSIDYSVVRIKTGFAGAFSATPNPFVMGNTIYMKNEKFTDDNFKLLVHEMTHVWQHQNGGTDYMSESLWSQNFGKGYEWDASIPKTPWNKLEPEQQAAFLEAAYESGFLDPTQPNYMEFFDAVQDDPQLTKYALDALKQLHNGAGAP